MLPLPEDRHQALPEADRLLAAAIYLMTCHARSRCPRLAMIVEHHLELLARHPEAGERVATTCRQLASAWRAIRGHDERWLPGAPALTH